MYAIYLSDHLYCTGCTLAEALALLAALGAEHLAQAVYDPSR